MEKMNKIEWTLNAKEDLQDIYSHYSLYSEQIAFNLINRISKCVDTLQTKGFEFAGMVDEYNPKYRRLIEGNYKILYSFTNGTIFINRIFDTRQSTQKLKDL